MAEDLTDRSALRKGEYVDYFEVGHNFVAFYLDCGQVGQLDEKTAVHSRFITSPVGAKRLAKVLDRALEEYARRFGVIRNEDGAAENGSDTHE